MAVLGFSGFDNYDTTITGTSASFTADWTVVGGAFLTISANGRRGTRSLSLASSTSTASSAAKAFGGNKTTATIGFSFKARTVSADAGAELAALIDGTSTQLCLHRATSGVLSIYRGNTAGTLLESTGAILSANTEYYIELLATISNTGSYEVRVDGVTVLSGTGVDTSSTANQYTTGFRLGRTIGNTANGMTVDYDDVYWADDSGASPANTFLGAVRVDQLAMPTVNGTYAEFTPSTGTNHALVVDEIPPNTTDYIDGGTAGLRDTFAFGDLATLASQTIYSVQVKAYALKDDAGARTVGALARLSGTDLDSTNAGTLTTTAAYYNFLFPTKPGGGAWTEADVNAAEFGVRVAS